MQLTKYFGDRRFWKTAILLTLPILVQNLLTTSFALIDTLMISSLGRVELTAVGLAASWIELLNVSLFGITGAAGVMVAQFWGGRQMRELHRSYGGGFVIGLGAATLFALFTILNSETVMGFYSNDASVIAAGAGYLRLVALGFPAFALQHIANSTLRSTERVHTPMYGTLVGVFVNIGLNYALIFGHFGLPRMGMEGAAIASCAANWVGVFVTYGLAFGQKTVMRCSVREMFAFDLSFMRRYIVIAWPIMLNEVIWGGGTAVLNMIYGHMGTTEYAALTMCNTVERLTTVVIMSLANSANVLVGKEIGRGRQDVAYRNAMALSCWTPVLAVFFATMMVTLRYPVTAIFRQDADVTAIAVRILILMAITLPLRFFQYVHICGILRAGADGKRAAFYDFIGVWGVSVPTALIGMALHLDFLLVFLLVQLLDGLVKSTLVLRRFLSKKWMIQIAES